MIGGVSNFSPGMNRPPNQNDQNRFSGNLRHYHRAGSGPQRSWDDWVEGGGGDRPGSRKWGKIIGISLALLALGGVIAGLIIELR